MEMGVTTRDSVRATGDVRLLSLPKPHAVLKHIFPLRRRAAKVAGPVLVGMPPSCDGHVVFGASEHLFRRGIERKTLADPRKTTMRIGLNLERSSSPSVGSSTISLFGYAKDLRVHRVLPNGTGPSSLLRETQQRYLPPVRLVRARARAPSAFQTSEVAAASSRELRADFSGEQAPVKFFCRGKHPVRTANGGFALTMELPSFQRGR